MSARRYSSGLSRARPHGRDMAVSGLRVPGLMDEVEQLINHEDSLWCPLIDRASRCENLPSGATAPLIHREEGSHLTHKRGLLR